MEEDKGIEFQAYYKITNKSDTSFNATWFKESVKLVTDSRRGLSFQNGGSRLTIDKVDEEDEGIYTCVVLLPSNSTFITEFHLLVQRSMYFVDDIYRFASDKIKRLS